MMTSSSSSLPAAVPTPSAGSSPCAACKFLRRKCQPDCVFAPYFPPDQPQKFARVHKVFGASNVTKLLGELNPFQREDAVNSLAYEAEMRLRDPVYGCVGVISILQHQLRQLQIDLSCARSELSRYQSAAAAASNGHGLVNVNVNVGHHPMVGQFLTAPDKPLHHMMLRSYDAEVAARLAAASGTCDAGFMAAMSMSAGLGAPLGGQFPRARAAGGDEGQAIGP